MVLICTELKFVFLKTMKTAGTSFEMVLERFCGPPDREVTERTPGLFSKYGVIGHREMKRGPDASVDLSMFNQHLTASDGRSVVGPAFWEKAAIIGTVRNPYHWALSLFFWRSHLKNTGIADQPLAHQKNEFNGRKSRNKKLAAKGGAHLGKTFCLTHLIRFERLQADLGPVLADLRLSQAGINVPVTKNIGAIRHPVSTYYSQDSIDAVRQKCAWMFEHGGYDEDISITDPVHAPDPSPYPFAVAQ